MNSSGLQGTNLLRRFLLTAAIVLPLSAFSHWPKVNLLGDDLYLSPFERGKTYTLDTKCQGGASHSAPYVPKAQ